ncbi:MAG: ATP-binding protein [Acidobacteria bacterium]|nr:ATP-binding protein [Acidobacteriota bacterium]
MLLQQRRWFDALTQDRTENANTLEKPSMRGVQRSVVDKYSDQAHFIYELLQNADDARATSASFVLTRDGLVFKHNGETRFSISDPATEEADSASGALGHVNAITSIANSNKTAASIGKFGVGFKSVFQYTKTPHIYDPAFCFRIERFIVPHALDSDFPGRQDHETVFWLPFDDDRKRPLECHDEIAAKLKSLIFPTLFLFKLGSVSWEVNGEAGGYTKRIIRTVQGDDLTARLVRLASTVWQQTTEEDIWLFSRASGQGLPFCVGFSVSDGKLRPMSQPAFCFFPTKESTNLSFIVHAPFLLTDSREGIKAGEKHNQDMVEKLACLASDSLPVLREEHLIDDGILDIVPYDEAHFSDPSNRSHISFKPFYDALKERLKNDTLLPAADGAYSDKSRSYWASDTELVELFSDKQLAHLTGTEGAHWVFRSLGKKEVLSAKKNALADYIDGGDARSWIRKEPNLIVSSLDPEAVLKRLNAEFIGKQPYDWLHRLYAYLSERESYRRLVKDRPIFLDQDGNAVPAFDSSGHLIVFLPDADIDGYTTVNKELLENRDTRVFIEKCGITKPSLRDDIYNKILPQYRTDQGIDTTPHFMKFFRYFNQCKNEDVGDFIQLLVDKAFLKYTTAQNRSVHRGRGRDIYLSTDDLKLWFEPKPDSRFLLLDEYREAVGEKDWGRLDEFLMRLGVAKLPRILSVRSELCWRDLNQRGWTTEGHSHTFDDKTLDGCKEVVQDINPGRSLLMWRIAQSLMQSLNGVHSWFYHKTRSEIRASTEMLRLRTEKWILNKSGELVSASEVTIQTLSDEYDATGAAAESFVKFLGIRDESLVTAQLTEEQKRKIKLAEELEQSGLSEEELRTAIRDAARRKREAEDDSADRNRGNHPQTDPTERQVLRGICARIDAKKEKPADRPHTENHRPAAPTTDSDGDADDFRPRPLDYSKKLDRAKDRLADEINRLEREQELSDKAASLPKYSYGWFLALLELECMASADKNADGETLSLRFGKVERDRRSARTIILKEPDRFIPQSIEEFSGVRVDLQFGDGTTGKLQVDSFTAREFSLEGKLDSPDELEGVDVSRVVEARIDVQNPSFLLQSLLERFRSLRHDEKYDMKAGLPENIEFVFGPPGTGKTTHLAERVLLPLMNSAEPAHVLVLAPTNKAADVLITRILDAMGTDASNKEWLVRFGTSSDERIEQAGVWRDRSFDFCGLSRSVVVTTVARFAYDGFTVENGRLHEIDWDVIVMDEASMIPIASVVYPIYAKAPAKFIIAGDPFQIEPIVAVEQWKDENIYSLTGLSSPGSFRCPVTEPHSFNVTHLKTQFRSIPDVGEVFSRFTYDGMLSHYRGPSPRRGLRVNGVDAKPLNLIKFPVSKYESIYRPRRLKTGTPYQTYSALFSFEFMCHLAGQVAAAGCGGCPFKIGIIAPYRAQANIIDKLVDSWDDRPDGVAVQVGTIHGFQGDECDAIIAVFNPPPNISANPQMFLNRHNILNVAISRARDYLFIIMPDEQTENIRNLQKVSLIESLVKERTGAYSELAAHRLEEMILGSRTYLEDNTFSTGHQMVNVYKRAERQYEVRCDESAVDVQISIPATADD